MIKIVIKNKDKFYMSEKNRMPKLLIPSKVISLPF